MVIPWIYVIYSLFMSLIWYIIAKFVYPKWAREEMHDFFTNAGKDDTPESLVLGAAMTLVMKGLSKTIGPVIEKRLNLWLAREVHGIDVNAEMTQEELDEHAGAIVSNIQPGAMPVLGKLLGKRGGKAQEILELVQGLQALQAGGIGGIGGPSVNQGNGGGFGPPRTNY